MRQKVWRIAPALAVLALSSSLLFQSGQPLAQTSPSPDPTYADALWAGRSGEVLKVAATDGGVLLDLADGLEAQAVAADELAGQVWAFGAETLRSFDFDGTPGVQATLSGLDDAPPHLAAHDGTVWLGVGDALHRLDASGALLETQTLDGTIRGLSVDPVSGVLLAITKTTVFSFDADGEPIDVLDLGSSTDLRDVSTERGTGSYWLASRRTVERRGADGMVEVSVEAGNNLSFVAADGLGGAWSASPQDLVRVDGVGQVALDLPGFAQGSGSIVALTADVRDGSVWVATQRDLTHVAADGELLLGLDLQENGFPGRTFDLAFYTDLVAPELTFDAPSPGAEVTTARPELQLSFGDIGLGVDPSTLDIASEGTSLPIDCDFTADTAVCGLQSDLPAGAVTLTATVADFAGNVSAPAEVTFTVILNRPPVLAPIGDQTVPLGSTLTLDLEADDPDGDPLTFSAAPLPLPQGALFGAAQGLFTYTPDEDEVGTTVLTFSVSDGIETASEAVAITVVAPPPGTPTALAGRILDTNDFVTGVETPVVGAIVRIGNRSATSGADGHFMLSGLPFGEQLLRIDTSTAALAPDGSPYAGFAELIVLPEGVTRVVDRPFFLPRIARESLTPIDPTQTTEVENPTLNVTLRVPPLSARNPNGTFFTGELSVSEVPEALAPAALPEALEPGLLITIQPVGVTFSTPVPITLPNVDLLPPGSEVDLWSLDPNTGTFQIVGIGRVSPDGSVIETISGGIRSATWHAALPPTPGSDDQDNNDDNQDPDKCDDCNTGSETALSSGNLQVRHELAPYRSLNELRNMSLVYNSETAAPQPVIQSRMTISRRAAVPRSVSSRLQVGGLDQGVDRFTSTAGLSESVDEVLSQAVQLDGTGLATGRYPYRLKLSSNYSSSTVSSFQTGGVLVHNQASSPLGTGWGLDGVQRVLEQSDGSVLVSDGNGAMQVFSPAPVDLRAWREEGPPANGNWIVSGDGLSVLQTVNGNPTFFVSPDSFIDTVIRGRFRVETTGDDDYVGFVIGYQSPLAAEGDDPNDFDFLLFDWKQANQAFSGFTALEGFALSRVQGRITDFFRFFWGHTPGPEFQVLATDFGTDKGWLDLTDHDFELIYQRNRIKISIDGRTIFDLPGTFEPGRFGFYNFSQAQVRYRSFTAAANFESPPGDFSTLVKNNDGTFTRTFKDGTRFEFDPQGRQSAVVDRNGNATSYTYDAAGRLTAITDPVGLVTTLAYSGDRLAAMTDPAGRTTTFEHDGDGRLVRITDPDGTSRLFGYDGRGRLVSQTSKRGFVTSYGYDFAGRNVSVQRPDGSSRLIQPAQTVGLLDPASGLGTVDDPAPVVRPDQVVASFTDGRGNTTVFVTDRFGGSTQTFDPLGRVSTAVRDDDGNPTRIVTPGGRITDLVYDSRGNLVSLREAVGSPLAREASFEYEPLFNNIVRLTDAGGAVTTLGYDGRGNATRIVDPLGGERRLTYDSRGLVLTSTDAEDRVTLFAYDSAGNLAEVTDAAGRITRFGRDAAGNLASLTEAVGTPLERTSSMTYDARNRLLSTTNAAGDTVSFTYDAAGNQVETVSPTGQITLRSYDPLNRETRFDEPGSGATDIAYDGNGNILRASNALGQTVMLRYDASNRLVETEDALGSIQRFTYDVESNLTAFQDAVGRVTTFDYDRLDRQIGRTNPLGESWTFAFDSRDRLTRSTDPRGLVTEHTFDDLSRRTLTVTPEQTLSYVFDGVGNLLEAEDADSHLVFTYDALDRVSTVATVDVGVQPAVTLTNTHDALGNRVSLTDSLGGTTAFSYDDADRLVGLVTPGGGSIALGHDADGRIESIAFPNGITADRRYDTQGRLSTLAFLDTGGAELLGLDYLYDPIGQIVSIAEGTRIRTFAYDDLQRLVAGGTEGLPETYSYDAVGNRVSSFLSSTYQVNAAHRLLSDDDFLYQYDANGNLTQRTDRTSGEVTTFTYDAQNQLVQVDLPGGGVASYRYDALGRRIEKNVDGSVERYVYDGQDIVLELDGAGQPTARYTHGSLVDQPLALETGGESYFYLSDHLGSIRFLVDSTGEAVNSYEYDSFGRLLVADETVDNPFTFTGREHDAETGLYYLRARYYDPQTGRFVSEDPIGFAGGDPNLYAYAFNDPVSLADPSGLITPLDVLDVFFFFDSLKDFIDCPGLGTGFNLALDTISLLPIIPSLGIVNRADDVLDAVRRSDDVVDAARRADDAADAARRADDAADAGRSLDNPGPGTSGGDRAGKDFTPKGKQEVIDRNRDANGGTTRCQQCGVETVPSQKSQKGVTPPSNETQVDHINPKSKGGDGSPSNGQVLCRTCNRGKSDKYP